MVFWCVSDPGRSCRCVVCRLMGIRCFVGGGEREGGRLIEGRLCRVGTVLGVAVCVAGCGDRVG